MYYRIADLTDQQASCHWKSGILSSLYALVQFIQQCPAGSRAQLRVFSSPCAEHFDEMLAQESGGTSMRSLSLEQFVRQQGQHIRWMMEGLLATSVGGKQAELSPVATAQAAYGMPVEAAKVWIIEMERRRFALEQGPGGDHDLPYTFALPPDWLEVFAWMRLLTRVHNEGLEL